MIMKENKDIVDYLHEKRQLEIQLHELKLKTNLLPTEIIIIEEIEHQLNFVNKQIDKFS